MDKDIAVALIKLVGAALWPLVFILIAAYLFKALKSGVLNSILPHGGAISYGDARLEVKRALDNAESSTEAVSSASELPVLSETDAALDEEAEPYDLVMDTWYDLSDAITNFAVKHGGDADRRQVWSNLERLVDKNIISEAQKGAVRDLQKARNSIKRLQVVDRESAKNFAETARRLTSIYNEIDI